VSAGPAAQLACPNCGAGIVALDSFCEACGTELAPAAVSAGAAISARTCPDCPDSVISPEGYCGNCGRRVPTGRDHQELDLGLLAGVTDRGLRHHRNEDAMALATADQADGPVAVAVVCDGISTSDRPDEASLAAAMATVGALLPAVRTGADLAQACPAAVAAAAAAVDALAGDSVDQPSATLLAAVVTKAEVMLCWLGDSRAYWLAPDASSQRLTRDDSLAEEMVAAGLMTEAEAMNSAHAHVVTRWLGGDSAEATPHVARFEPPGPGVVLLCSDGLWNYQPDPGGLAALALPAAREAPLAAASGLIQFAVKSGGADNITAVLIPFPPAHPAPPAESVATARLVAPPAHSVSTVRLARPATVLANAASPDGAASPGDVADPDYAVSPPSHPPTVPVPLPVLPPPPAPDHGDGS
jgi:serine/threonine protein phosphatase PrpC